MGEKFKETIRDTINEAPWGTHICLFYQSRKDLIDILVPYFKAGLEKNEFCMWVTSEPLPVEEAKASLKKVVKNLDNSIRKGQIEILDASHLYTKSGKFEADKVWKGWVKKERDALKKGFNGLRLAGDTSWLGNKGWRNFADYESMVNKVISKHRMAAICSYFLDRCGASEVIDVVSNHQLALLKKRGKWELIESSERKKTDKVQVSLYKISESAHSAENLEELYRSIHNAITELMPAKNNFYIALYDAASKMLSFPYFVDEYEGNPGPQKLGKGLTEYVLRTEKPLLASPKVFDELEKRGEVETIGPPSIDWLGVPLKTKDRTIGVLAVQSYTEGVRYSEKDKNILTFISEQAAMAIERKKAEEELRRSREEYVAVTNLTGDIIVKVDKERRWTFLNDGACIFWGRPREKLLGVEYADFLHPDDIEKTNVAVLEMIKTKKIKKGVINRQKTPKGWRIVEWNATPIFDEAGNYAGMQATGRDITERNQAEEQIKVSLMEKDALLKEIHHRVKNNMQVISSLLSLGSRNIKDEQALEIFKSSQNRVKSMALIHERLYQSTDLARIDFTDYVRSLTRHLISSYGLKAEAIKMNINIQDILLDINTAIPCGLIINELVTNSLKHAFPDGKKGEIKIAIHLVNKNEIELIVSDDGVGLPEEVDFRNTESLGLHLVTILAEDQLHGDIKLNRTKGTTFHLKLKVKK